MVVFGSYSYDDKNVGNDKTVTFSGLTLSGADAGNYILAETEVSDNNAVITPRPLDVSVVIPTDKVYDGTTDVDSQATLNDVLAGDDVTITAEWQYNSPDVISAATINNVVWQLSGDDAANYALPDVALYDNIAATITPKDVQVTFETDSPYYYTGWDQSSTVSASYIDIYGNKISVKINWYGEEFKNPGTYRVAAVGNDPNYNLIDNKMTLVMNPALIQPGFIVYTDGTNPIYASSVPAMQGQILANDVSAGDIYSYTWSQLISETLLDKKGIAFEDRDYPGMNYGTDFSGKRVTVDTLKYRPFELDTPVKELALTISGSLPQALVWGKELFIDGSEADQIPLLENHGDSFTEYHEELYVENDYTAEEQGRVAVKFVPQTLQIPARLLEKAAGESGAEYDVPALDIQHKKVSNLKTDLEKLLDELAFIA